MRAFVVEANLHAQACAAFELSQRLDPQLGTKFNLAGCYVHLGKIATAWQLYKELSRSDSNAQRRAEAARLVTELEPRVPKVRVRARGDQLSPDLRVFVGSTEVTSLLDADIPFDPGRHVISASSPGYLRFRREIAVQAEEAASVEVSLHREPAPSSEPVVPPKRSARRIAGTIMLATGTGLAAFGAVAGWRWHVNAEAGESDRATAWAAVSGLALASGVTGAIVGGSLLTAPSSSGALHVAPAVGSSSASLLVNGAF
jgi:hypothetical protein